MNYFISNNDAYLNTDKIYNLLKYCFWYDSLSTSKVEKFIGNSVCFGIFLSETTEMIGFARVITDKTTYAYLCDVVIKYEFRRCGLGAKLVKFILNFDDFSKINTWMLHSSKEAKEIYSSEKFKIIDRTMDIFILEK